MELVLWIAPLHVAPVVSYEMLKAGRIDRPKSGLDRFNLTEIGEHLILPHLERGGRLRLKDVNLPFPWKAELLHGDSSVMRIDAMTAGKSTYRSMIRIAFESGNGVCDPIKEMLGRTNRDPLSTPYWDLKSWEVFHRETGLTFDDIRKVDESTIEALGL